QRPGGAAPRAARLPRRGLAGGTPAAPLRTSASGVSAVLRGGQRRSRGGRLGAGPALARPRGRRRRALAAAIAGPGLRPARGAGRAARGRGGPRRGERPVAGARPRHRPRGLPHRPRPRRGGRVSDHVIVIPVYNEAPTIGVVVREARPHGDVLVVDDGSTDGAGAAAAAAGAVVVRLPRRSGKAAALPRGVEVALSRGAPRVVTVDGD